MGLKANKWAFKMNVCDVDSEKYSGEFKPSLYKC